jgi:hypothetical protein
VSEQQKRVDRIVKALTPKQVVLAHIAEGRRCRSFEDYVRWHEEHQPELHRQVRSVIDEIRDSFNRERKRGVNQAVTKGIREFAFLLSLQDRVQKLTLDELREGSRAAALLTLNIDQILLQNVRDSMSRKFLKLYPLDVDDAAAVTAVRRNHQLIFAELESQPSAFFGVETETEGLSDDSAGNPIDEWVTAHFIEQGRRRIPLMAYLQRIQNERDENWPGASFDSTEDVLVKPFKSRHAYRDFALRQDFSFGFADVHDIEFMAVRLSVLEALRELVKSGSVKAAAQTILPSVPPPFLRRAKLIEGKWLDRHVMVLAEFGAMLAELGFTLTEITEELHPLAWPLVYRPQGSTTEPSTLLAQAVTHLSRFDGRSICIDGRPYIDIVDYQTWSQRRVKGELKRAPGFAVESFNQWLAGSRSGEAKLAGVTVESIRLPPAIDGDIMPFSTWEDSQWARVQRNAQLTISLADRSANVVKASSLLFRKYAMNILSMQAAVDSIQQKYFAGCEILLDSSTQDMKTLAEKVVSLALTSEGAATPAEAGQPSDSWQAELLAIKRSIDPTSIVNNLVTSARADALWSMGFHEEALKVSKAKSRDLRT